MSTMNPKSSNGKQSATGSSLCTPSGTPVNSIATNTGNSVAQNSPPPCANAPKYGTLVPNRIFVGGIAANTTEAELLTLFTQYGTVKAAKIIQDRAGVSKGYGFVTFENEQDAHLAMRDADNILLRERKLNIAPAIKKQPFSRVFGESTSPSLPTGNPSYYMTPGTIPYYQGGVTYFSQAQPQTPGESATPQATMYQPAPQVFPTQTGPPQQPAFQSVMFPAQPMYMPQFMPLYDYNYYATGSGSMAPPGGQYMVGGGSGGAGGQGAPPLQPPPTSASPPRPPPACYGAGQQLGTYGAPPPHDSMYYAMPAMYGPPMDAASAAAGPGAIYATECIELPNGGYGEETPYASLVHMDIHNQHHPHNHPSENGLDSAIAVLPSVSLAQHSDSTLSLERQSNTPVVSLLNIDHHQEKDYTSMQSGRRRKSTSSSSVVTPSVSPYLNGYTNNNNNSPRAINNNDPTNSYGGGCYQNIYNTTAYPPCTMYNYNGSASPIQLAPPSVPVSAAGYLPDPSQYRFRGPPMNGGFMFAPHKKRRFVNHNNNNNNNNDRRPPTDQSRRSSVRTNSNSSTSVGEELRDERGFAGGSGCMFAQSSNHSYGNYSGYGGYNGRANNNGSRNGSRNYNYNGTRVVYGSNNNYVDRKTGAGGSGRSSAAKSVASVVVESGKVGSSNSEKPSGMGPSTSTATVTAATETGTATGTSTTSTVTKDKSVERDDKGVEGKVVNGPLAQVHPSGGNPSFLPPRRSRRTVRRSGTTAGSSLSEIGAGDAPLPQDLTDACSKKMEGLKL